MQVHQIVNHPTLKVIFDLIDYDLLADIYQFDKCQVLLFITIYGLVDFLIISYSVPEICCCYLWILALVVWRARLHVENVAHDDAFIITFRLDVKRLYVFFPAPIGNPLSPRLCRIRSIQDCNVALTIFKPTNHIRHSSLSCCMAKSFTFGVGGVEEICLWLWSVLSTVGSDIELFCRY